MSLAIACPRCGNIHCVWSEDELFCPDCLLQEGPDTFKYREDNPYLHLTNHSSSPWNHLANRTLTRNTNLNPVLEEFEFHQLVENQIPNMDLEEERIEEKNESESEGNQDCV